MRPYLSRAGWTLALLALAAVAHAGHGRAISPSSETQGPAPLPNGEAVRLVSSGHATSIADLYWLKLVQYVGTPNEGERWWPQLEPLADLVVTVDPLFGYAYEASGVVLSSAGRYESSNAILERGISQVPTRWQLPFFAGFNYWSALGDLDRGAEYVLRASKIRGSPRYLPDLAARLFSSAGSLDEGIAGVDLAIRSTQDPHLKEELVRRRDQMETERALRVLENAIASHLSRHGVPPARLAQLDDPEAKRVAASPLAEQIRFDAATGAVSSPLLPRRLMVYRPSKVPDALAAP